MATNCTISIAHKAKAILEAHPGKPILAFYTALTSGSDDAADVAVAIALDPLCGINHRSAVEEGTIIHPSNYVYRLNSEVGGTTALMIAASENILSVAERLLEIGADLNLAEENNGFTALHLSPSAEMAALLLRYNANPHAVDRNGGTPLHSVCFNNRSDSIPLLAAKGSDVNAQNKLTGSTPLHVAATSGHVPSITALIAANADSTLLDNEGRTPIHHAVANSKIEAVAFLASQPGAPLNERINNNWTALQSACYNGRPDIVRVLLENNAAFDAEGCYPMGQKEEALVLSTLLEFGCPASKLLFNNFTGTTEQFSVLLDAGCDVDETGRKGMKLLHCATLRGYSKVISLFAAEGANLHAVDAAGWTPLHHAASMECDASLDHLISLGANVNAVSKEGQTPLHIAAQFMLINTMESLVQLGCNVHIRDYEEQSALDVFEDAIRAFESGDSFIEPPLPDVVNRIRQVLETERTAR